MKTHLYEKILKSLSVGIKSKEDLTTDNLDMTFLTNKDLISYLNKVLNKF